ncbi:A/G-specific adenine glycosylase [Aliidiomarina taiwanensis]|uniref:Adenine DNA glycosylase n=1 Tax=Aliidiomarina taiwanensis TaxID=946228 RepID=A0A432X045_9GAMM|nr:A/G-specific adenine glycosylase [Aliidiomarina taiwanensis]RUO39348.1 A/G-specific adenine glycosylase [Aliidiomarina taiwanensis]
MQTKDFATTVLSWQKQHGRHDLPWQQPATPYRVLVSEIMLQQTQVTTVIPYFQRWMDTFPTLETLAQASEDEVMALWQGLGYYSRARNLRKAAQYLVQEFNGKFPNNLDELLSIPGVGPYTAGAIRSFAFNDYGPIVDGNVKRFFCRLFGIEGDTTRSAVNKQLWNKAADLTPSHNNRHFAQGLLDIGATLCTPANPDCARCPFRSQCFAYKHNMQKELPTPKAKKKVPVRKSHFLLQRSGHSIQLEKRPQPGIWAALWCLPELSEAPASAQLAAEFEHTFSHFKMRASIWSLSQSEQVAEEAPHNPQCWVEQADVADYGLPSPIKKVLPKLWEQD